MDVFKKAFGQTWDSIVFPRKAVKDLLVAHKYKRSHHQNKWGDIQIQVQEYMAESSRTFGKRFKEHLKPLSPIYDHCNITGHTTTVVNLNIVGRDGQNLTTTVKESTCINGNPLTKTLANTISHIFEMKYCLTPQKPN